MRESGSVSRQHSIPGVDWKKGWWAWWGWGWGDRLTFPKGESWRHQLEFIPRWKRKLLGKNKQKNILSWRGKRFEPRGQHSNFIVF